MKKIVVLVNGSEIALNNFARRIVLNILSGLLNSLTLPDEPREAVFRISE